MRIFPSFYGEIGILGRNDGKQSGVNRGEFCRCPHEAKVGWDVRTDTFTTFFPLLK